jgi:hypothetical protein
MAQASLGLALLLFFAKRIDDYDLWFHLVVGREVVTSGQIPDRHFYIAPLLGQAEQFFEWGFGTLLYLIHSVAGATGVAITNALLAAGTMLALASAGSSEDHDHGELVGTAFAVAEFAPLVDLRAVMRPEMVLMASLAIAIPLLERFRSRGGRGVFVALPALAFMLANIHPSVLILIGVAGMYGLAHWSEERTTAVAKRYGLLVGAMFVAACANPYGPQQVLLPFLMTADPVLMRSAVEFLPVRETVYAVPFAIAVALVAASALVPMAHRRARVLVAILFAGLAWVYSRNIGLLAVGAFLPVRAGAAALVRLVLRKSSARVAVLFVAASLLAAGATLAAHRVSAANFGLDLDESAFPRYAAALRGNPRITGIAAPFHHGGYIAWKTGIPVLADGRNYTFNGALAEHDKAFSRADGWPQVLERARTNVVFVPTLQTAGGTPVPLLGGLVPHNEWALCAVDPLGSWFARTQIATGPGLDKRLSLDRMLAAIAREGHPQRPTDPVFALAQRFGDAGRAEAYSTADFCL